MATTLTPLRPNSAGSPSVEVKLDSNKSTPLVGYVCMWDECGENFESLTDLTTHLMLNPDTSHLIREGESCDYHVTEWYHFLLQRMEISTVDGPTAPVIRDMEEGNNESLISATLETES